MSSKVEFDRKDLKSPDALYETLGTASRYFQSHRSRVIGAVILGFALLIGIVSLFKWREQRSDATAAAFLRATDADKLTLLDPGKTQPTDRWYWAALVYDGKSMRHFVDGNKQLEGSVAFPPTGPGRISLGVRQNRVHWFKGCIAQVRFTPVALNSRDLQRR